MVNEQQLNRRALSAELALEASEELESYRSHFLKPTEGNSEKPPFLIPMVYPFQSTLADEQIEEHIIEALSGVKKFKVLLRGITGYPGGFVLVNVKAGNDRLILMHDLLHQGPLKAVINPLYTFFPHVLLFRCPSPEATRDAVMKGQEVQGAFEATVDAIRIENVGDDGALSPVSAIELE